MEGEITHHPIERWISRILRFGVWSSATLMVAGLAAAWFSASSLPLPEENPSPTQVFRDLFNGSLDPAVLMFAGLLMLMLTPFLRVLTAAAGFAAEKDRKFTIISLVIFAMLAGELLYSLR